MIVNGDHSLNLSKFDLIPWFNNPNLEGMYKADLCRAAYVYLHGGYYFDVDLLTIRPYVAPIDVDFVTVKGTGFLKGEGFFQAFMAASKGNQIVYQSLVLMKDALWGERDRGLYLGPSALSQAYLEAGNVTEPRSLKVIDRTHLLTESSVETQEEVSMLPKQNVPPGFDSCEIGLGACNFVVTDIDHTVHFYSRILGTRWCGKILDDCNEGHREGDTK